MPLPERASRERLAQLGIDVWVLRGREPAAAAESVSQADTKPVPAGAGQPRLRLASGDGDWLLVQNSPWDGRHARLLDDIQALIGPARCRFGQWAHSDSAGVAVDELASRGIRRVLAFDSAPGAQGHQSVLTVPSLDELASSAEARKRLWQALGPRLND